MWTVYLAERDDQSFDKKVAVEYSRHRRRRTELLDFGIAKLLHPDWSLETNEATATMFRAMPPEYASPEQIRGLPVTTASDVYSLGVVLYELLTGERPYKIESRRCRRSNAVGVYLQRSGRLLCNRRRSRKTHG